MKKRKVCVLRQAVVPETCPPTAREVAALVEAGYEVYVIAQRRHFDTVLPAFEQSDGLTIYRLAGGRRKGSRLRYLFEYVFFFVQAFFLLSYLHLRHRFAVIQVNTLPDFLVFVTLIPRLLGARILLMMKEPTPELWETIYHEKPPRYLFWVERWAMRYAHLVFTVTGQLREIYIQRGAKADKIRVMLNVPEPSHWLNGKVATPEIKHDTFTMLCHGTIEDRYGHDVILDAMRLVREEIADIRLRISGHGSKAPTIEAMIAGRGLEDVVDFLGWASHQQLIAEIKAADIGIVGLKSSSYSNLIHTNKMFEYILFKKPVILSRLEAVNVIFRDDAVAYYEPGDAADLARVIIYLYRHPEVREVMAQRAYDQCAETYAWHLEKVRYLEAYSELMG